MSACIHSIIIVFVLTSSAAYGSSLSSHCDSRAGQYPTSDFLNDVADKASGSDFATPEFLKENCRRLQSGKASYYGDAFHGRTTASGDRFDKHALTAASNTRSLGSEVFVLNPETGQVVKVTINDTGGFKAPRVIDLSEAAFEKIGDKNHLNLKLYPINNAYFEGLFETC